MSKIIISCAVTGSIHTPSMSPYLPVTPEAIAEQAIGAAKAGAAILHLHARDPETGRPGPAERLSANDIADVTLTLDRAVAVDAYTANRDTGGFILIDRETTDTAALGLIQADAAATPVKDEPAEVRETRSGGGFLSKLRWVFGGI